MSHRAFDRRALLAGAGAFAGTAALPCLAHAASPADRVVNLAAGVDRVEAVRAAKRLQNAFAHYCNAGRWGEAGALFARAGSMRGRLGQADGPSAIAARLRGGLGEGSDGLRPGWLQSLLFLSPVINVSPDGRSAKGRWHSIFMLGGPGSGSGAEWAGEIYENDYVFEDGVWKIARLAGHGRFEGPYDGGWRNTPNGGEVVAFHYDARNAGIPIPPWPSPPAAKGPDLATLSARIERLNDEALIQNLQDAYGFYVDRKMWDDVADLFAEDGTMQLEQGHVQIGRAGARQALEGFGPEGLKTGELNDHAQLGLVITVARDGRTAVARGLDLGMTGLNDLGGRWSVGTFENRYVKSGGVWRIAALRIWPRMACDYANGWAKDAELSASTPPFSFPHPVRRPAPPPQSKPPPEGLEGAERRLAVAAAYDGAENVCNAYGYYIDEFAWDDTADIFAHDGWKELSYVGPYLGRERIRASLKKRYGPGGRRNAGMTLHQKIQPVVTVAPDGRSAHIRERLLQLNSSPTAAGSYIGGIYENQCVLEDGVWKISAMDLDYVWLGDYATGWTHVKPGSETRFSPPASFLQELPPDRPLRGVVYPPFPKIAQMGFHYRNPVSGRSPELLLP